MYETATGVRSSWYEGPHPSHNGGGPIVYNYREDQGGNDEINQFLTQKSLKAPVKFDMFVCPQCQREVLSKLIRHTPLMGFLCTRCVVSFSDRCYLSAGC